MTRPRDALAAAAVVCVFIAPAHADVVPTCRPSAKPMARLELLFGARWKGGLIGKRAWASFLDREVTPRFPAGLTVFEGAGQWRNGAGKVGREPSRLLLIWYEPGTASDGKIEAIRSAYKKRFEQESVMRVDEMSCVSF